MRHTILLASIATFVGLGGLLSSGCNRSTSASPSPQATVAADIRKTLTSESAGTEGNAAEEEVAGTGWGTLKGKFVYAGDPPTPGTLEANRDQEVCNAGGALLDNSLVVGPDKGIGNIVVYARVKRVHDSAAPLEKENELEPLVFDQKECMFLTHVLACQVNHKIDIKNSDPVGHNTKIDPQKGVPINPILPANSDVAYTPTAEEALPAPVSCSIHPWMRAYILPRSDKYFAVTADDGTFEIPNLPAGEQVELQVWHERGTGAGGALVLPRKDLKWTSKGRFVVTIEPDETLELALDVPPSSLK